MPNGPETVGASREYLKKTGPSKIRPTNLPGQLAEKKLPGAAAATLPMTTTPWTPPPTQDVKTEMPQMPLRGGKPMGPAGPARGGQMRARRARLAQGLGRLRGGSPFGPAPTSAAQTLAGRIKTLGPGIAARKFMVR